MKGLIYSLALFKVCDKYPRRIIRQGLEWFVFGALAKLMMSEVIDSQVKTIDRPKFSLR